MKTLSYASDPRAGRDMQGGMEQFRSADDYCKRFKMQSNRLSKEGHHAAQDE